MNFARIDDRHLCRRTITEEILQLGNSVSWGNWWMFVVAETINILKRGLFLYMGRVGT